MWSEDAWKAAEPTYNRILQLDFVRELMAGTLSQERFLFYIRQDALYVADFGKAIAGIASRLNRIDHRQTFLNFAGDCVAVERALHESYMEQEPSSPRVEQTPTCLLYTSYMLRQLSDGSLPVAMASVLPCFWVYKEVGDYISKNQNRNGNPFQAWIDTYNGEEYASAVKKAIAICDEVADTCTPEQRKAMTEAYVLATKMEWMFWESAWRLETWPV